MNQNDNLIYFLTDKMTKGKIYPPQELASDLSREYVALAWQKLVARLQNNEFPGHNLGLYLHFPFCPSKCRFCYCFSEQENNIQKISRYIDSMIKEIDFFAEYLKGIKINTIYVGGGTPSYLTKDLIAKIFRHLLSKFEIDKSNYQFNFEASPSTLNQNKLKILKELGVNRLSIGVQSLDQKVLKNIKREQEYEMVKKTVNYARKIGIDYINLDYVAGLPGETLTTFTKGFTELIKLRPDILHLYKFYPADNTIFYKEGMVYGTTQVDLRQKMIKLGEKFVKIAGYKLIRNEFEAWGLNFDARNKQDAERKEKPYSVLGLGNYAKSHIFSILHYQNGADHYFGQVGHEYRGCYVDEKEEMRHFIISAGRGGFYLNEFKNIFQQDPFVLFAEQFKYLKENGWLEIKDGFLRIITKDSNQFNYLMKKLFYKSEIINKLRDYYQNEYQSEINYEQVLAGRIYDNF